MRRVLIISPHFPPDSSAGTHRVRLLAPHLERYGWEPTVLTVEPNAYEGTVDPDLPALVPSSLRVVRAPALSARVTRRLGIGDLGLRSLPGLYRVASRLLQQETFDALFISIFPAYTALLGPRLARRFSIPFVLDYQDPWVGAWGDRVGGGRDGRADFKSRVSRFLAEHLEPRVVRAASAITAVSSGTYEPILLRNPGIRPITAAIPIGADPQDFVDGPGRPASPAYFDPDDGLVHVCYTGTILPLGMETLTALFEAVALLRDRRPELYRRVRLHFFGTSNQSVPTDTMRAIPLAEQMGVGDVVREVPMRLPYSVTIRVQQKAAVLLALGSSEHHYTPSKIFPLLLARRPVLALYHERSSVTDVLARAARPPSVRLVTYSDTTRARARVEEIFQNLAALVERPVWNAADIDQSGLREFFAESLAGRLAAVFDQVAAAGERVA